MSTVPDVAVIVAAHNVETYIERAIRSALDQQGVTVEIIVVNDGSTDKTNAVVTSIADPRVKCIDLPDNRGPGVARNVGIAVATAPWLAILDGDDAFLPGRLARLLARLRMLNADIAVDNLEVHREAGGNVYPMFPPNEFCRLGALDLATFIDSNVFFGGDNSLGYLKPIFSTEFWRRHGLNYEADLRIGEDYLLMCEALAAGALCAVEPALGYLYTMRKGSTSHRLSLNDIERITEGDKRFLARHKLSPAAAAAQRRREANLREAHALTRLVDALKRREVIGAGKAFIANPLAARHLWLPAWVRIAPLIKRARKRIERLLPETDEELRAKKTIFLFYKEYEKDSFFPGDRYLKRILRPLYRLTHRRQKKSGFAVSFALMRSGLEKAGYDVRVNDYHTAHKHPDYPVGAVGYPSLLEDWTLPNPVVLGPSLYDHPLLRPNLFDDPRFKKYVVLAPWTLDMYKPVYGDRCFTWFAGIDIDEWPDLTNAPKQYDFLVYDKIRWDHDEMDKSLLQPILRTLESKGLSYRLVRYKMYDHATYRDLLAGARGLLFICEHETQGLAYQEAMASNVPVLAWDAGFWADPLWQKFMPAAPAASAVPFFSPICGETFRDIAAFPEALDRFMSKRPSYHPRDYVASSLTMEESAKIYADQYFSLLTKPA